MPRLLSVLAATTYRIVIDRAIGTPGHGKDLVDGLNATDKRFLREKFCMTTTATPEETDSSKTIAPHAITENAEHDDDSDEGGSDRDSSGEDSSDGDSDESSQ